MVTSPKNTVEHCKISDHQVTIRAIENGTELHIEKASPHFDQGLNQI